MAIVWTSDLEVGVKLIDDEHKELYKKVNELFEACSSGKGKEFIEEMINFLSDYTIKHFGDEERLMKSFNYPSYPKQKAQHEVFIKSLDDLKKDYHEGGKLVAVLQANSLIINWLNSHIMGEDKKIGQYIKEQKLNIN